MFKMLLALLVGLTLVASATATVPSAAAGTAIKNQHTLAKKVHPYHNKARAVRGIKKLKMNTCLTNFAKRQATNQAKKRKMYHQDLRPILKKCNLRTVGENVAYGFTSAKSVHRAWMNSPGHKRNILNKKFTKVGYGAVRGADGHIYWAVVFGR